MAQLSDRQALVLALFNYGLVRDPKELAAQLRVEIDVALAICRKLEKAGLVQLGMVAVMLGA